MAAVNERPIIFALSNPDLQGRVHGARRPTRWTGGRALFASGSPFQPVVLDGRTYVPRQGNNAYVFPGIGLGALACGARRVTDEMFLAAARALAAQVTEEDLAPGRLYPPLAQFATCRRRSRRPSRRSRTRGPRRTRQPADLAAFIRSAMYEPRYREYGTYGR